MTLYLFNYNNYYNRLMKREENIKDYSNKGDLLEVIDGVSFINNNGINTEQIINYDGEIGNYAVVTNDNDEIISRWFVIEMVKVRAGQYNLKLYRDVIADWWYDIVAAPVFVEKATLSRNNPLIFNNENMTYNQIKKSETPIMDNSQTPWYVAYINKEAFSGDLQLQATRSTPNVDITVSTLQDWEYYKYTYNTYKTGLRNSLLLCKIRYPFQGIDPYNTKWLYLGINIDDLSPQAIGGTYFSYKDVLYPLPTGSGWFQPTDKLDSYEMVDTGELFATIKRSVNFLNKIVIQNSEGIKDKFKNYISHDDIIPGMNSQEWIIHATTDDKYYKAKWKKLNTVPFKNESVIPVSSELGVMLQNAIAKSDDPRLINPMGSPFVLSAELDHYTMTIEDITETTLTIPEDRAHCEDAPYDIWCFPKETINVSYYDENTGAKQIVSKKETIKLLVEDIMGKIADEDILDIQILPYCPIQERMISRAGNLINFYSSGFVNNVDFVVTDDAMVFFAKSSNFAKEISPFNYVLKMPDDNVEFKIANETEIYRLCSPNYNGQFEFSAAKNNGITGYNVTCTLRPVSPYIKVAPIFNGIYGNSFDDARGLICGGDFSISQKSEAWLSYERNNKNYQVAFDRQITNMNVNNSVQKEREIWQAATGALSGGASAGIAAGMVNPIAGVVSGIGGALLSGIAGARDVSLNEQLRNEAIDYAKDQFGYQLGNIKALPYNLTKVTAINEDNKVFPFLEYYTCTDVEKDALRLKLKYNGMTVGAIDQISNYIGEKPSYIKCQLIRLEIGDNFNIVKTIANELNKGVFV